MCIILRIYIYIIYKTIKLSLQQRGIHSTKDDIKKKKLFTRYRHVRILGYL